MEQHNNLVFLYIQNVLEIDDETFNIDEEQHAVVRLEMPYLQRQSFTRTHPLTQITFTRFRL